MEAAFLRKACLQAVSLLQSPGISYRKVSCLRSLSVSNTISLQCRRGNTIRTSHRQSFSTQGQLQAKSFQTQRKVRNEKIKFGLKIGALAVTAAGFAYFLALMNSKVKTRQVASITATSVPTETPLVGGDWELVNQDGKTVTNKDFYGNWCLVYFGFTHCPDICPDELEKITEVMNILDRNKKMPKLIPLFITVDPDRDKPADLKEYLSEFSNRFVGLTGSWEQLRVIIKEFKVYFSIGPKDEDGDYIVDHSIITFLMNPEGRYTAHFPRSKSNIEVANLVEKYIKEYKPSNK